MNDLMKLGEKYGAMKLIYTKHQYQRDGRAACQHLYPKYLEAMRGKQFNLLEIGVGPGGSLHMWREYFPRASIYGLDIDPNTYFEGEKRIKIWIGDQADEALLSEIIDEIGDVSLVIDDAGHTPAAQATSFNFLFPYVTPGGLYIIEDLRLSYSTKRKGGGEDNPEGIIYYLDQQRSDLVRGNRDRKAEFIHYHNNVVIVGRQ
jgi:hypothetical protein